MTNCPEEGEVNFELKQGDCREVLATLEPDSIDSVVSDPPYGLSPGKGGQDSFYTELSKICLPEFHELDSEPLVGSGLSGVSFSSSLLGGADRAVGEESRVTVPKSSVDFEDAAIQEQEIRESDDAPGIRITDRNLAAELKSTLAQHLGHFVLELGHLPSLSATELPDSCLPEFFPGGIAVPVRPVSSAASPSLLCSLLPVDEGHHAVFLGDDSPGHPGSSPGIGAISGTVNSAMLRFDLRGRPVELSLTRRADHLSTVGQFAGPQLVGTTPATGRLSSVAEPCLVRVVNRLANGASPVGHIILWIKKGSNLKVRLPSGGFMGQNWDSLLPDPEIWRSLFRVMKPGAYGLMFGGTRTYHRVACALEDAGFEIRDCLGWLYGSGFPKSSNQKGDWTGFGTALKPAWEPIVMFRKPSKLTVPKNLEALGVGALNIDGCRVGDSGGTRKEKPEPGRETVNCYGSGLNGCVVASTDKGRWPANILHDGSDEVMAVFPEQKSADKRGDCEGSRPGGFANVGTDSGSGEPCGRVYDDKGSAARFFYCAKANRKDRDEGLGDSFESTLPKAPNGAENCVGSGRGSMSKPRKNSHPTVKPTALMQYLCRLVTPPGGLVLDPFNGSGSTGKAALLEGFRYLGIEQSEEYIRISEARLRAAEAAR